MERVDRAWTTTDYLLACVVDLLSVANYQFVSANSKRRPPQKPKPLKRPRDWAPKRERGQWLGQTIYSPGE